MKVTDHLTGFTDLWWAPDSTLRTTILDKLQATAFLMVLTSFNLTHLSSHTQPTKWTCHTLWHIRLHFHLSYPTISVPRGSFCHSLLWAVQPICVHPDWPHSPSWSKLKAQTWSSINHFLMPSYCIDGHFCSQRSKININQAIYQTTERKWYRWEGPADLNASESLLSSFTSMKISNPNS